MQRKMKESLRYKERRMSKDEQRDRIFLKSLSIWCRFMNAAANTKLNFVK
jgi:hypothetical protein